MREDVVRAVPQLRHGLRRSCDGNRGIERPDTAIADLEKQLFFLQLSQVLAQGWLGWMEAEDAHLATRLSWGGHEDLNAVQAKEASNVILIYWF